MMDMVWNGEHLQSSRLDTIVVHSPGCSVEKRWQSPLTVGVEQQAERLCLYTHRHARKYSARGWVRFSPEVNRLLQKQTVTRVTFPIKLEVSWQTSCDSCQSLTSPPAPCYGWSLSTKTSCASYRDRRPSVPIASSRFHHYSFTASLSDLV